LYRKNKQCHENDSAYTAYSFGHRSPSPTSFCDPLIGSLGEITSINITQL